MPRNIVILVVLCMFHSLNCDQTCETRDLKAVILHLQQFRTEFQRFKDDAFAELQKEFQMFKDNTGKEIEELRKNSTELRTDFQSLKDDLKSELQMIIKDSIGKEMKSELQLLKNATLGGLRTEIQTFKNATFGELKTEFQRYKNATFEELKTEFQMLKDATEKDIEEQPNTTRSLMLEFQEFKDATENELSELRNNTREIRMEFQMFKNTTFGELKTEFQMFKDVTEKEIKEQRNNTANSTSGTAYVRWGRTSCPGNGSELVYQGVAGGSYYAHPGAAVDHLCLPLDPTYGDYYDDTVQDGGLVYGAEYEFGRPNYKKFFPDIEASPDLFQLNVPCAVCHVAREAMIMVPAKTSCMPGWTLEYKGLLMTGKWSLAAANEYICLDDQPQAINGTQANDDGKLLYFVEGRRGSLPCPPYVNGRELTCAVCTK